MGAVLSMVGVALLYGQHVVSVRRTVLRLDLRILEVSRLQGQSHGSCQRSRWHVPRSLHVWRLSAQRYVGIYR